MSRVREERMRFQVSIRGTNFVLQLRMAPLKIARMKLLMPNSGFGNDVGMLLPRLQPGIKVFWMLIFVKKRKRKKEGFFCLS